MRVGVEASQRRSERQQRRLCGGDGEHGQVQRRPPLAVRGVFVCPTIQQFTYRRNVCQQYCVM